MNRRHSGVSFMVERVRARAGLLARLLDLGAKHPLLATSIGLALIVLMAPLLNLLGGADGPLGPSIPLFFLAPVLLASAMGGRRAGVLVSVVAIVVWDWYFIHPLYTVTIASPRDVLALIVFLAVALLVGQLATAVRTRAEEALRRARSSEALYDLSMALIAHTNLTAVLPTLTERLRTTFDLEACAIVLPDAQGGGWRTVAVAGPLPPELRSEESKDVAAVVGFVKAEGRASGLGHVGGTAGRAGHSRIFRPRAGDARAQFLPLRVGAHPVGVLELVHKAGVVHDQERERLLVTFANGAAIALEQERLGREEQAATLARESDRLKSVLLSSVSHDLRTPLAGIKAAASSLLQDDVQWSEEDRRAFITDIDSEADRLTRLVSNLLDLSRIEAGALQPQKDWEDVGELIERVLRRLEPRLAGHVVLRDIPGGLPPVRLDAVQIEQVMTNSLENAAKYSPPATPITVAVGMIESQGKRALRVTVSDQGVGIPPVEQERVFDKFYRVTGASRYASGTGMGLAIVKGLVAGHGGHVAVFSAPGEGSTFTVDLPIEPDGARSGSEQAHPVVQGETGWRDE